MSASSYQRDKLAPLPTTNDVIMCALAVLGFLSLILNHIGKETEQ